MAHPSPPPLPLQDIIDEAPAASGTTTSTTASSPDNDYNPNATMIEPFEAYGRPHKEDLKPELLLLYPPEDLTAVRMYKLGTSKPIVLSCMGIGVPEFPNVDTDETIELAVKKGKAQMFPPSDIRPSSRSSKNWLLCEIYRRCVVLGVEKTDLPSLNTPSFSPRWISSRQKLRSTMPVTPVLLMPPSTA